jgi:hypothetical protein
MEKSYVRYTILHVEDELMNCIYFVQDHCTAQPHAVANANFPSAGYYKPTDDERKEFCNNAGIADTCPRFKQYKLYLGMTGLDKTVGGLRSV